MLANGIHTDLVTYYKSLDKGKAMGAHVLPGHDPLVFRQKYYPAG
jgi:glyoxylase-like metal-dependent hydrolase (beta-lactamase superfamily II)